MTYSVSLPRFLSRLLPVGWLLLGLLLAGCANLQNSGSWAEPSAVTLAQEPLLTRPWSFGPMPGTLIQTDHYRVYTTIKDPLFQRMLSKVLEAGYSHHLSMNPQAQVPGPMVCYVFADRPQWEAHTQMRNPANWEVYKAISQGGYCQEGVFAGYDIGRRNTLSVIAHEGWHQFSWYAFKDRLPSWLEEGLATQYEALEWDGVTPRFVPAQNYARWKALQAAWRGNRLWKVRDLTSTHAGRVIKKEPEAVDAYYAQLWAMVLFLEHSAYKPKLEALLEEARQGKMTRHLVGTNVTPDQISRFSEKWNETAGPLYMRVYLNQNMDQLEKEYLRFIQQLVNSWPPKLNP